MAYLLKKPTSADKLRILGKAAQFDVCGVPRFFSRIKRFQRFKFIYPATGKGGCVRLFKVLQTNICEGNCFYCANRKDRDSLRIRFSPEELARIFIQYYQKGFVDGLFLSSAIYNSPTYSQEETFKTLYILRKKIGYKGYIHYKILPGSDETLVEKCAAFADRLSINLEAPSSFYLSKLSPTKKFNEHLLKGIRKIALINKERPLKAGITTQLVVGAAGEKDRDIITFSNFLYKEYNLWRVLIKKYGFSPEELPFQKDGNLPQEKDPKLAWALAHQEIFPVEINKADFWELLRVPGIGRTSARRIVEKRRKTKIKSLEELKETGCVVKRARNFITLNGKFFPSPSTLSSEDLDHQLFLWEEI